MDVRRYLVFNKDNEFINLSLKKIEGDKLIIPGKTKEDILKFNPNVVICYQNEDIVYECKKLKKQCIHIYRYSKFHQNESSFIANLIISPFDLTLIEKEDKDYRHNFSMISECSDIISELFVNFIPGNRVLVNPGEVLTSEILDFYGRRRKDLSLGEDRKSISSYETGLSDIKTFFKEDTPKKVNIYLATYHRLEKTKKSLESIIKDIKLSIYDVKIYIGDNSPNFPEMREWLKTLENDNVCVHLGDKNIGKSGMVNYLYKNSRECDYLFSIDSDMIVTEGENFVDKMLFHLTRLENCGLVSSHQLEFGQHWIGKTVEIIKRQGMDVGYSRDSVGVAGGCIVLRSHDWEKIGMYKEGHDIYTGDDGILTYNIQEKLGKYAYISMDCQLIHPKPSEDEKEYTQWKAESWQRDQLKFLDANYTGENKKGYFD